MKTTLDINDALVARAKASAVRQGTTLTRIIEEGLRLRLAGPARAAAAKAVRLPVFAGRGGLQANIDPTRNSSLLAAADEHDT